MPKSSFDKNMEKVSAEFDRVAHDVKDTAEDIGNRWTRSTTEEKITMIIGIILLVRALITLRSILRGIVLLTLGLLSVSGFFDRPLRDLIRYCKKEFSGNAKRVSSPPFTFISTGSTATWLNFTTNLAFYQNSKEIISQNACYKKWVLRIKATSNMSANLGKPDFDQKMTKRLKPR